MSPFFASLSSGIAVVWGWKLEGTGTSGRDGVAICLTACKSDVSCSVSEEKVGWNSSVNERGSSKICWKRDTSSEANKSGLESCETSKSNTRIVYSEDEEQPQDNRDTHSVPISSEEVEIGVIQVRGTRF